MHIKPKELFEISQFGHNVFRSLLRYFSTSAAKRLILVCIWFALFFAVFVIASNFKGEQWRQLNEQYSNNLRASNDRIRLQNTIEKIDLCLQAQLQKNELEGLYCDEAISSFKGISPDIQVVRTEALILKRAFGAMKVDTNHMLRISENESRLFEVFPKQDIWLKLLTNDIGRWMVTLIWLFYSLTLLVPLWHITSKRKEWDNKMKLAE